MLTPEELQKENDRLKAELATYQAAQKAQQQQKGNFIKRLGSIGSWFFLGGDLKQSIKQLVIEARDKNQTISDDTLGNVLAHGAWRLTRIGCFAVLVALIPLLILMIQTTLLYYQNKKLDVQNELFNTQNSEVKEQNTLVRNQNELLTTQNTFFKQQLEQIDTQNTLFRLQNIKVGEQTDLLANQNGLLYTQNNFLRYQTIQIDTQIKQASIQNRLVTAQNRRLDQQTNLQEAERRSSLVFLFSNVMDAIDRELREDYDTDSIRNLSPQLIGRVIALTSRLKPYRYLDGDSLISKPLSPERGQLLVSLVESQLDSSIYFSIFQKANFHDADLIKSSLDFVYLKGIRLTRADLRGAQLRGINLQGAFLMKANLMKANLMGANLQGAYLSAANLSNTDLSLANLSHAKLSESNLSNANVAGAILRKGIFYGVDLSNADLNLSDWSGAILADANLINVDLIGADLAEVDLEGANLIGITLYETNFINVKLNNAMVDSVFFIKNLKKRKVKGYEVINERYYVDPVSIKDPIWGDYYLIKEKSTQD